MIAPLRSYTSVLRTELCPASHKASRNVTLQSKSARHQVPWPLEPNKQTPLLARMEDMIKLGRMILLHIALRTVVPFIHAMNYLLATTAGYCCCCYCNKPIASTLAAKTST